MKRKSALNARETAVLAAGYENLTSYEVDEVELERLQVELDSCHTGDWHDGIAFEIQAEVEKTREKLILVEDIYQGLIEEILLADPFCADRLFCKTQLVIAKRAQLDELDTTLVPELCTVTKLSLAKWFWQHDHNMARRFWPSITEGLACMPSAQGGEVEMPLSGKTKNTYLKTIAALSNALIDGLSGKHNPDADAVLAALAAKGVEAPLKQRALSDYLKEAQQLD